MIAALPASILRMPFKRVDIRNHRKLIVVDGKIAQTGSRNVADPDFKGDASGKVGAYIDSWIRIRGPVARDLHILFLEDWGLDAGLHGSRQLPDEPPVNAGGVPVQAIPSGPNFENNMVAELIQAAIQLSRREIVLTTPYFLPALNSISNVFFRSIVRSDLSPRRALEPRSPPPSAVSSRRHV